MIILTCRNGLEYTKRCLPTLLDQHTDIVAVDNASKDGTAQWLRSQMNLHNGMATISLQKVESVAHVWNEALYAAWRNGQKRALVVNNDIELLPNTYAQLCAYINSGIILTCVSVGSRDQLVNPHSPIQYSPHPDYSCFMITREAHQRVPFDESFEGAYFEDNDHHVRMHRAGLWAGCIDLPFLHHASGTLKCADAEERARIERNATRNKQRFFEKYGCYPGTKAYEALFTEAAEESSRREPPAEDSQASGVTARPPRE